MKSIAGKSVEQDQKSSCFPDVDFDNQKWERLLETLARCRQLHSRAQNASWRGLQWDQELNKSTSESKVAKKVSLCQVAVFLSNSSKCGPLLNIYATVASFEVLHALTELWVEKRLPFSTEEWGQTSCSSRHIPNIEPRWPKCKGKNHPCFRHFFLGDTPRKISIDTDMSLQLPVLTWAGIVRNRCFWRAVFQVMPWDCKLRTLLSKQTCIGWW